MALNRMAEQKTKWPETIGLRYEEAVSVIKKTFTGNVVACFPDNPLRAVFVNNRVVVLIGRDGRVIAPGPHLG